MMVEFSEWQIFLLSAVIGFFIALGFRYATISKTWTDKRAITSEVMSNAVLGAIYGAVVCAVSYLAGVAIKIEYLSVFSYILITIVSAESITKLLEKKVGQAIRLCLGFADNEEKQEIAKEITDSKKEASDKIKAISRDNFPNEIEVDLPSDPKPEQPPIEPLQTTDVPIDTGTTTTDAPVEASSTTDGTKEDVPSI